VSEIEWCARRVAELARRRALAALRKQIEAVDLATFAAFLQRWQHLHPRERLDGAAGLELALHQLQGLARPPEGWERDYLPARLGRYEPGWLSQLSSGGQLVWAGGARRDASDALALASLRFFPRGEGALWMSDDTPPLSEAAERVREALARHGASFLADIQAATGLGMLATRDALRELVAAGLATNDTVEAMREIVRTRALPGRAQRGREAEADPTRWLPSSFTPSPNRPVVQRRVTARRLPKWRRPDLPGPVAGWVGRWSLLRTPGTWGEPPSEEEHAELVARQWLDRYGVVTRDWWRRERPPVSWRAIYRELKRLEYRGEVRRGYFVEGLGGAQFALPDAVERLRALRAEAEDDAVVVMSASDPANPYSLALETMPRTALERPRGSGALLVTRRGRVLLAVEGRGRRVTIAPELADADVTVAARALGEHLTRGESPAFRRRPREPKLETIDGVPAALNSRVAAFVAAGWRRGTEGLTYFAV
jgi:ATP-dependent Lhr-like helicase